MYRRNNKTATETGLSLYIPRWTGRLYISLAILLLPWIIYLALTLPAHHRTTNWDVVWTGFDVGLLIALAGTAVAAYKRSVYIVIAAAASGTLLLVDSWFDVITEQSHRGAIQAVVMALIMEIPLSFMSFYLASHALRHHTKSQPIKNPR